ncbi:MULTISPECIES: MBL fold metallo-hydrolase [unclassified Kitasatospora]|uniref:MBL fold metallo-hydrolase n=1 Tax=unclassified Kitasatospora TaxID=2633591 RepID=UPI0033C53293
MRRLTVLGTSAAYPEAGRAASGFLLEYDGYRLVLDLGYATFPRLLEHTGVTGLDAVVITHEHPDHCADLSALCRARYFAAARPPRLPLYCTPGVVTRVQAMEPTEDLHDVFDIRPLPATATASHRAGPLRLDTVPLPHHVPHAGVRLSAPGLTLAYSGDAGPGPGLAGLAAGADLFVAGATVCGDGPGDPYLLSAAQAGQWAKRAGAARLLLTHFWPGTDRTVALAEARRAFGGDVTAAEEDLQLPL